MAGQKTLNEHHFLEAEKALLAAKQEVDKEDTGNLTGEEKKERFATR